MATSSLKTLKDKLAALKTKTTTFVQKVEQGATEVNSTIDAISKQLD